MASVNFPKDFDFSSKGTPAPATPQIVRIRSDNSTYTCNSTGTADIIRIEIPTGGRNQYLFPNDSFITFKFTPTFTVTAGNLSLDTCAYSMFRRARILQGSTTLCDQNHVGRLWNCLRDIQVSASARSRDEIALCTEYTPSTQQSASAGFAGKVLTSGAVYDVSFVLPLPLLGSLTNSAVPIGQMGASSLFLELELNPSNVFTTTRVYNSPDGAIGVNTTALPVSSFVLSDIYYSAKMCQLDDMYQQALMSVYQNGILLPSVDYINDMKAISSGSSFINEKLAFNKSSVNAILWWLTPSAVASGSAGGTGNFNLLEGVSCRCAGALKDYTIQVSGNNLLEIKAGNFTGITGYFYGSQPVLQLHRCYNFGLSDGLGILNQTNFSSSLETLAECEASSKRFVGAYSLERYSANHSFQSGMSLIQQDTRLVVNFDNTQTTIAHNLYCYAFIDVAYEIRDGVVSVRS